MNADGNRGDRSREQRSGALAACPPSPGRGSLLHCRTVAAGRGTGFAAGKPPSPGRGSLLHCRTVAAGRGTGFAAGKPPSPGRGALLHCRTVAAGRGTGFAAAGRSALPLVFIGGSLSGKRRCDSGNESLESMVRGDKLGQITVDSRLHNDQRLRASRRMRRVRREP
jgi:hypothetical protein